ncbi:hypothetical protein SAMN06295974_3715 [Plantibacter flavus]|uniref:Uncharacterized protein n=1 Tax=Plantibacter flavus TaxID=150123 RepID=A0A3N2BLI7_9MICO|nr:hypothetical protein [Plantibacter flavus]ROR76137.1 hypothetical protein EDD42_4090 [Plantibacter flavus]SMG48327.1 hypothetical protein SAMN06295974_3715 [Plantibacter flavus]
MATINATDIGRRIGSFQPPEVINFLLTNQGYLTGKPGKYHLTPEGERFGEYIDYDNGYGGFAHRQRYYTRFDESILGHLDTSPEQIEQARQGYQAHKLDLKIAREAAYRIAEEEYLASLVADDADGEIDWKQLAIVVGVAAATITAGVATYKIVKHIKNKKAAAAEQTGAV